MYVCKNMYVYDCVCIVWSQETTPLGSQYVPILCACPALKPSLFFSTELRTGGTTSPTSCISAGDQPWWWLNTPRITWGSARHPSHDGLVLSAHGKLWKNKEAAQLHTWGVRGECWDWGWWDNVCYQCCQGRGPLLLAKMTTPGRRLSPKLIFKVMGIQNETIAPQRKNFPRKVFV